MNILSQDKKILLNTKNIKYIIINIKDIPGELVMKTLYTIETSINNEMNIILGVYEAEERAKDELLHIQKAICSKTEIYFVRDDVSS